MIKSVNLRAIVLDILMEVNENGAFSHHAISDALKKYQYLEKKDRAFITRLANGTIERQITLDYVIDEYSQVAVKRMKSVIRNVLRMAVYQIMYMDGVPNSAACDEAVKLTNRRGFFNLSGFVNGVLRTVVRSYKDINYPDKERTPSRYLSIYYSVPEWIVKKWLAVYDFDSVESMLIAFLEKDDTTIRVNTCKTDVKALKEKLESQGITVEDAPYVDEALRISGFNYLDSMAEFRDGLFTIQDVSSMLVGKVAGVKSGDYVIDVCAAPGGKSLHVAELLKGTGYVEARDLSENKVELIRNNIERMGFVNIAARTKDALVFDELSEEKADIVLADLPCSGLGVIGNKVDLKYKMSATAITELEELQRNILAVVNRYVKLGGVLIYSTCTINPGENIDNVRWFAKTFNFELESISEYLPEALRSETTDEGYIQLLPSIHDCDGFFVARLKRVK